MSNDNLPFPVTKTMPDPFAKRMNKALRKKLAKPETLAPANQDIIALERKYRKKMPVDLRKVVQSTAKFYLDEVLPVTVGAVEGLHDALEAASGVLETVINPTVPERQLKNLLGTAVGIKTLSFVANLLNLSKEETNLLIQLHYAGVAPKAPEDKEGQNEKLLKMLEVLNLQGQEKGSEVLLREIQASKRGRQPGRSVRSTIDTARGSRQRGARSVPDASGGSGKPRRNSR